MPRPPSPPDHAYEWDPEAEPPSGGPPPWWKQRPLPTSELERVRNRQRANLWFTGGGDGAPVHLRADVAQALASLAYDGDRPVEDVPLDDLVDRLLAERLGLERAGLPSGQSALDTVDEEQPAIEGTVFEDETPPDEDSEQEGAG